MLLSCFSAQLIAVFAECDPSFKASDTSKFQGVEGSALAFGLHRIYEYAVQAQTYTLFCVSPMLVGLVSFQKKLDGHKDMLESMESFDVQRAKCTACKTGSRIPSLLCRSRRRSQVRTRDRSSSTCPCP
eukprot:s4373_g2.t1